MVWSLVTAACPLTQIIPQPVPIRALGTEHGGGHFSVSSQNPCRRTANALVHEARGTRDGAIFGVGSPQEQGWQATQSYQAARRSETARSALGLHPVRHHALPNLHQHYRTHGT